MFHCDHNIPLGTALDYSDVLIVPSISEVKSRKDVSLEVETTFRCGASWRGVPIMAANMSTVATHEMAKVLAEHKMVTCLRKGGDYYSTFAISYPEIEKYVSNELYQHNIFILLSFLLECLDHENASSSSYCLIKELGFPIQLLLLLLYMMVGGTWCLYKHYRYYMQLLELLNEKNNKSSKCKK